MSGRLRIVEAVIEGFAFLTHLVVVAVDADVPRMIDPRHGGADLPHWASRCITFGFRARTIAWPDAGRGHELIHLASHDLVGTVGRRRAGEKPIGLIEVGDLFPVDHPPSPAAIVPVLALPCVAEARFGHALEVLPRPSAASVVELDGATKLTLAEFERPHHDSPSGAGSAKTRAKTSRASATVRRLVPVRFG